MEKKYYSQVNIYKIICAVAVVYLHTTAMYSFDTRILKGINLAIIFIIRFISPVNFFFVTSGYFFFTKKNKSLNNYILNLVKIYIFWSFFYINDITCNFQNRSVVHNCLSIVRQFFFTGYSMHTWFIPALIYGVILVNVISKKKKANIIVLVVTILGLLGTSYMNIMKFNPMIIVLRIIGNISFFRSTIFVYIGYLLANKKTKTNTNKKSLYLWLTFFVLMCIELAIVEKYNLGRKDGLFIFLIPMCYYMLDFILNLKLKISDNSINFTKKLGKISTNIYFSHVFIKKVILILCPILDNYSFAYIQFFFVLLFTLAFIFILDKMGKMKNII